MKIGDIVEIENDEDRIIKVIVENINNDLVHLRNIEDSSELYIRYLKDMGQPVQVY